MAEITVLQNGKPGRIYRFTSSATIGRDSCNEIQLRDQRVSRRHVIIEKLKSFYILKDLNSRNGTYVNGLKVRECELSSSDRIALGNTTLVFHEELMDSEYEARPKEVNDINNDNHSVKKIRYTGLQKLSGSVSNEKQKQHLINQLTEMLAYSASCRPIESGSMLFQEIQEMLHKVFKIDRSYILLIDKDSTTLKPEAVRITRKVEPEPDFSSDVFENVYLEGYSLMLTSDITDTYHDDKPAGTHRAALVVPIRSTTRIYGIIYVDSLGSDQYTENDLKILSLAGLVTGTTINSWQTYRRLQIRSLSAILAIAEIAEKNDMFEKGKSIRIAARCQVLCEAMGLPDDQIEMITIAAILAVFMSVRDSVSDITETLPEDNNSNNEPNNSENGLISTIKTFAGLQDVARIIKHRNDNYDGAGTKQRLDGNALPLGSRILKAVFYLEYFDGENVVLRENLKRASGTILDPVIVKMLTHLTHNPDHFNTLPDMFIASQEDTDS